MGFKGETVGRLWYFAPLMCSLTPGSPSSSCSVWTSKDVSCSTKLPSAHSIIWEPKHLWIVQCFHGLVGFVIHEQGAWSPAMYHTQQKETTAAWGMVGAAGELFSSSWSPQLSLCPVFPPHLQVLQPPKWACSVSLLSPLGTLWPEHPQLTLCIWMFLWANPTHCSYLLQISTFFLSVPLSAFLSTLSLWPYSVFITLHCLNIPSKTWVLQKRNPNAKRRQKYLIHKQLVCRNPGVIT